MSTELGLGLDAGMLQAEASCTSWTPTMVMGDVKQVIAGLYCDGEAAERNFHESFLEVKPPGTCKKGLGAQQARARNGKYA